MVPMKGVEQRLSSIFALFESDYRVPNDAEASREMCPADETSPTIGLTKQL
jgi:hypothetical protein